MKNLTKTAIVAASLVFTTPLTFADTKNGVMEKVKTEVYDFMDKNSLVLNFDNNEIALSDSEKTSIRSLVKSVRDDSKVSKIIVAAWSDYTYPLNGNNSLTVTAKEIAEQRAEEVRKVLAELGSDNIEVIEMVDKPSWLSSFMGTDEAEIKNALHGKTIENRTNATIADMLASKGGPSKVVVMVNKEVNL